MQLSNPRCETSSGNCVITATKCLYILLGILRHVGLSLLAICTNEIK